VFWYQILVPKQPASQGKIAIAIKRKAGTPQKGLDFAGRFAKQQPADQPFQQFWCDMDLRLPASAPVDPQGYRQCKPEPDDEVTHIPPPFSPSQTCLSSPPTFQPVLKNAADSASTSSCPMNAVPARSLTRADVGRSAVPASFQATGEKGTLGATGSGLFRTTSQFPLDPALPDSAASVAPSPGLALAPTGAYFCLLVLPKKWSRKMVVQPRVRSWCRHSVPPRCWQEKCTAHYQVGDD